MLSSASPSDPIRRIYFGILFSVDFVLNLFTYVCLIAVADDGWNETWKSQVAEYTFRESSFDILVLCICRSVCLMYFYTVLGIGSSITVALGVFGFSVLATSIKAAAFTEIDFFRASMLAVSLITSLLEIIVVVHRVRQSNSRAKNPFFSQQSFSGNTIPGFTFQSLGVPGLSILSPSLQRNVVDNRYIPSTSTKKTEWGLSIQDQIITAIITETRDNTNWRLLIDHSDILVFTKDTAKKSALCFKSVTVVQADPTELCQYIASDNYRNSWNVLFNSLTKVEELQRDMEIVHLTMPSLGPVKARDFCCLRVKRSTLEGGYVMGMKSIFHPDRPDLQKYVRGEMSLHGYHIRPHKKDPNSCLIYIITIVDLKGWVPKRVVDLVAEYQNKILVNLRQKLTVREVFTQGPERDLHKLSSSLATSPSSYGASPRFGGRTISESRRATPRDVEFDHVVDPESLLRSPGSKRGAGKDEASIKQENLLPRVRTRGLQSDTLIRDFEEFSSSWKEMIIMAVDLHLEDRVTEAAMVVQTLLRTLEQHRHFVQEHITEFEYWRRDIELARIMQQLEGNHFVQLIQRDNFEAEGWLKELHNRGDWRPLSLSEDMQIWSRLETSYQHATFLCEGPVNSPLIDCFAILNEVDQMRHWIPFFGPQHLLNVKVIANLTRMSKIVHVTVSLPFPIKNREIVGLVKGMEMLEKGHILLLFQSINSFEGIELPQPRPTHQRILLNAAALLTPVSITQTHVTMFVSVDLKDFYHIVYPLRFWMIRKLCESIFQMIRVQSQDIVGSDFEMIMADNPDLYEFIQQRYSSFVDRTFNHSQDEKFDAVLLHSR
eukprot:TRINITY_DN6363_c0_g1_i1.p1 TRINITY_DN6363_c0_g1~~TRINITY_DN6363_c0_g1_i1.p1  ORF type:complete len:830 (-),score=124.96 TRINITY_DN6363_c0_g1_i1:238-2727(-)